MKVIERPRNSGKTQMLLHYMELESDSVCVVRTEEIAKRVFELARGLGLHLTGDRFLGITSEHIQAFCAMRDTGTKILVDDADYIIKSYPKMGYDLCASADVITISSQEVSDES
ncbi:hypothetical protein LCGC14_0355770 [marine sediment metagenome]|uniref:Uncharacterized protein n=1 Tax=marine sediment metagenome TaxID=412755 RepID=A0A0F9T9F9_9ZZZZ